MALLFGDDDEALLVAHGVLTSLQAMVLHCVERGPERPRPRRRDHRRLRRRRVRRRRRDRLPPPPHLARPLLRPGRAGTVGRRGAAGRIARPAAHARTAAERPARSDHPRQPPGGLAGHPHAGRSRDPAPVVGGGQPCATRPGAPAPTGWSQRIPRLVGAGDPPFDLPVPDEVVRRALAAAPGLRIGRCDTLLHVLVPTILAQRVTAGEALTSWVAALPAPLPRRPGACRAPPASRPRRSGRPALLVVPSARRGAQAGRDDHPVRTAGPRPGAPDQLWSRATPPIDWPPSLASGRGRSARSWVRCSAIPTPSPVGDFHIPHSICWALAGEPRGSDERMLELLAPYTGPAGSGHPRPAPGGMAGPQARAPPAHPCPSPAGERVSHRRRRPRGGVPSPEHSP